MNPLADRLAAEREEPTISAPPSRADLQALAARLGITRLADLTCLDRLGSPVVQAVRPLSRANVVSQGKGATLAAAALSAVMEAAEAWAAERVTPALRETTLAELGQPCAERLEGLATLAVDPAWRTTPLDWTPAWDLADGSAAWLPLALVTTDFRLAATPPVPAFVQSSTGLGAGRSFHQACLQGLLEGVERDAVARARRTHGTLERQRLDLAQATGDLAAFLGRLDRQGFVLGAWTLPARLPVPVIWCWLAERASPQRLLAHAAEGMAAALDPLTALWQAIREAAQARITVIAGAREDIGRKAYAPPAPGQERRVEAMLETIRPAIPLADLAQACTVPRTPQAALPWLVDRLGETGLGPALAAPLATPEELGAAVVRVVVPGLEPLLA